MATKLLSVRDEVPAAARRGVIIASDDPRRLMATLADDLDGWDDLDEGERERLRELFRDLGLHLDVPEDPDAFE